MLLLRYADERRHLRSRRAATLLRSRGQVKRPTTFCETCGPKAAPFAEPFREAAKTLAEIEPLLFVCDPDDVPEEVVRALAGVEKLARAFDAILCEQCKRIGPPLPKEFRR